MRAIKLSRGWVCVSADAITSDRSCQTKRPENCYDLQGNLFKNKLFVGLIKNYEYFCLFESLSLFENVFSSRDNQRIKECQSNPVI